MRRRKGEKGRENMSKGTEGREEGWIGKDRIRYRGRKDKKSMKE